MSGAIEARLETLENQVRAIMEKLYEKDSGTVSGKDWRKSLGMFDNHPSMIVIDEEGMRIRQLDRQQVINDHS